jgi:hypothetical protein
MYCTISLIDQIIKEETGFALRKMAETNAFFNQNFFDEIISEYKFCYKEKETIKSILEKTDKFQDNVLHKLATSIVNKVSNGHLINYEDWKTFNNLVKNFTSLSETRNEFGETAFDIITSEGILAFDIVAD